MSIDSRKTFSRGKALTLVIAVGLLVGCFSVAVQVRGEMLVQGSTATGSNASDSVSATTVVSTSSSASAPGDPMRLIIPAIGVNAAVQTIGMSHNGLNIGIPSNFTDVGWYKYGPMPGMPGNAIIDGHLDGRYVPKAVFYNLGNLKPGDLVEVVTASNTTLKFQVVQSKIYDYTASTTDLFSNTSTINLDLITCAGDWLPGQDGYNERVVVFTKLASN